MILHDAGTALLIKTIVISFEKPKRIKKASWGIGVDSKTWMVIVGNLMSQNIAQRFAKRY